MKTKNNVLYDIDLVFSFFIFLFGLIVFTAWLTPEFINFQTRFALFAQQMWHTGISFFPKTYQGNYADYPAASTIIIYLISLLWGRVTVLTTVLPTAIVSSCILVVIYHIGLIRSRAWGLCAVLLALLTQAFLEASRNISPDQYISLITALCFYLAYSATVFNRTRRLLFIPLLLIIGFAFRGPIGLVIPTGVLCSYYAYNREFKKLFIVALIAGFLLMIGGALLLLAAYHQGGMDFVNQVINMQVLRRMHGHATKAIHFYYYWIYSLGNYAISYFLALIVIIANLKNIIKNKNADHKLLGCLTVWLLVILVGMSLPADKKIRYILSIVPATSLIAAYLLVNLSKTGILFWARKLLMHFFRLLPLLLFVITVLALILSQHYKINLNVYGFVTLVLIFVLCIVCPSFPRRRESSAFSMRTRTKFALDTAIMTSLKLCLTSKSQYDEAGKCLRLTFIATLAFIIFNIGIVEPVSYSFEKTKPLVHKVENLLNQHPGRLVFYRVGPDGEDIKFMANMNRLIKPYFIQSPQAILNYQHSAYFITKQSEYTQLPKPIAQHIQLLLKGTIGHQQCVVFKRRG